MPAQSELAEQVLPVAVGARVVVVVVLRDVVVVVRRVVVVAVLVLT